MNDRAACGPCASFGRIDEVVFRRILLTWRRPDL